MPQHITGITLFQQSSRKSRARPQATQSIPPPTGGNADQNRGKTQRQRLRASATNPSRYLHGHHSMCGPVFLASPLLSEPYGFKFTIVILNRRLLRLRRPLIMIFLMRTRTRRQPKTEGTDGQVGRQSLQSVSNLLRTVLRLNSAASTEKEGYGGRTAHRAVLLIRLHVKPI